MNTSRLIVLIFMVVTTWESSEAAELPCVDYELDSHQLVQGEAFYFVPFSLLDSDFPDEEFTWYKGSSQISTDENEMIHHRGCALIFLNLTTDNSGLYTARHTDSTGNCYNYPVKVEVLKADRAPPYGEVETSMDDKLLPGHHEENLQIDGATKDPAGIYTCICTWSYNLKVYNSSGSRRLTVKDPVAHRTPEILSPSTKEQFADEGSELKLNCSVFLGTNVKLDSYATWYVNGKPFNKTDGYDLTTKIVIENITQTTIATAILAIEKVSAKDFQAEYKCLGVGLYKTMTYTVTLKRRESVIPLVIGGLCVLFLCVLVAALVKFFAIDLALFFRQYIPLKTHNKDTRVYDAYVVYQTQGMDKVTEDSLSQFVTNNLPSILEEKCGYRLFIHGRDSIPGEDRLEQLEDRMRQSRRLIVILTPGSGSGSETTDQQQTSPQNSLIEGFDCQVGLHHVLVQREMSVILIQLGDIGPQGYTHFPPGLQHLIHKSAPIKWPEGSRGAAAWNSRFWKRVRYLMPATPAQKCPQSAII
ncbi:interleukin-1 receptor-like 1 [Pempheris klunzingeri]|uniref:interleukin-1 receptor-like 1 n=1 Tax=Pempheris klunzingeri TaxID=3127111 RepID=UPI00397EA99B